MSEDQMDSKRRKFLTVTTTGIGLVGIGFAAVPFVRSMTPSERAKAAGAPVEIDISKLEPGQIMTEEWRGKPVWIVNRTPEMLAGLKQVEGELADPASNVPQQPEYAQNGTRSIKPEILVVVGICTHLGCSPDKRLEAGAASGLGGDWPGGFFCPCHGSKFDLAGRVYKNVPAPTNLVVPPYMFKDEKTIIVGVDQTEKKGAA
jgi:ubiquinol-cytochrome c reductase iron-sulfur subunit